MYLVNDDMSIYVTRGDIAAFTVTAESREGEVHTFMPGDVIRFTVVEKKAYENVALQKDFAIEAPATAVEIFLTEEDTRIGEIISKPTDYWYEVELNPNTNPQTIIGYDEDGARVFKLFPEGAELPEVPVEPEDIPVVDSELDVSSKRPLENQAITREFLKIRGMIRKTVLRVPVDGWSSLANGKYEITIPAAGFLENTDIEFALESKYEDATEAELTSIGYITDIEVGAGRITITASHPPKVSYNICVRGASVSNDITAYDYAVKHGFEGTEEEWLASLKGEKGDKGDRGIQGVRGQDGTDGKDGKDGKDGVSVTHKWDGTVLTITSASGTSSADLQADKYEEMGSFPGQDFEAIMDTLTTEGRYRFSDGDYTYSVTVEKPDDTIIGQSYWTSGNGFLHIDYRDGRTTDGGATWEFGEWTSHLAAAGAYALFAEKDHKHYKEITDNDFSFWMERYREGSSRVYDTTDSKYYIVDQWHHGDMRAQRYFELSEPEKVYSRIGEASGEDVVWEPWQLSSGGGGGSAMNFWLCPGATASEALADSINATYLVGAKTPSATTVLPGDVLLCKDGGVLFVKSVFTIGNTTYVTPTSGKEGLYDDASLHLVGEKGDPGEPGKDGVSVTHSWNGTTLTVTSASGTSSANLKGEKGDKGDTGSAGSAGKNGTSATHSWNGTVLTVTSASGTSSADLKGPKGDKGDPGSNGATGSAGKDGVSATHSWNGTTLTVTSASGSSSANLKGDKGDKGDTGSAGASGKDGVSATHKWSGTTLSITSASGTSSADLKGQKGDKGDPGEAGKDGVSPQLTIGTVETLEAGSAATATLTGTAENPILNLGIPQGEDGVGAGMAVITVKSSTDGSSYTFDYVCDGVDDQVQIQEAILALPAEGGIVRLSKGTYNFTQPVSVGEKHNVVIEVDPKATSNRATIHATTTSSTAFSNGIIQKTGKNWTYRGIDFTREGSVSVAMVGEAGDTFHSCGFYNFANVALKQNGADVYNCRFVGCKLGSDGPSGAKVQGCYFEGCTGAGLRVHSNSMIVDNVFIDNIIGMRVIGSKNTIVGNVVKVGEGTANDYTEKHHSIIIGTGWSENSSSWVGDDDPSFGTENVIHSNHLYGKDVSYHSPEYITEEDQANIDNNVIEKNLAGSGGSGVSSWNDLTDKPFGTVQGTVFEYNDVQFTMGDMGMSYIVETPWFPTGETATIKWDGVTYNTGVIPMNGAYAFGNLGLMMGGESTGEPFVAMVSPGNGAFFIEITPNNTHIHSFAVVDKVITKIPQEYQNQVDFDEGDTTKSAYVKNRPFWKRIVKTITCDGDFTDKESFTIIEGDEEYSYYKISDENIADGTSSLTSIDLGACKIYEMLQKFGEESEEYFLHPTHEYGSQQIIIAGDKLIDITVGYSLPYAIFVLATNGQDFLGHTLTTGIYIRVHKKSGEVIRYTSKVVLYEVEHLNPILIGYDQVVRDAIYLQDYNSKNVYRVYVSGGQLICSKETNLPT